MSPVLVGGFFTTEPPGIFLIALISSGVYSDVKTSQIVHFRLACGFKTSLVAQTVKASAYKVGDPGSIPG